MDIKQLAPHPASGTHHRGNIHHDMWSMKRGLTECIAHTGYSAPGAEKVTQHVYDASGIEEKRSAPDVKESFEVGREDDLLMPNIWLPDGILPGFKEACLDFFWVCFG